MFEDVKSGKINADVALKIDRISRSKRENKKLVPDVLTKDIVVRMYQLYFEGNSY